MKYLLVLQLPEVMLSYEDILELENKLISELKGLALVDGHDFGVGEINFFIMTNEAQTIFEKIKPLFMGESMKQLKAAFREVDGEDYQIIYPPNLKTFSVS